MNVGVLRMIKFLIFHKFATPFHYLGNTVLIKLNLYSGKKTCPITRKILLEALKHESDINIAAIF